MSKSWTPPTNTEDAAEFERQQQDSAPGSFVGHFKSRFLKEPLVPLGAVVTIGMLVSGVAQFASSKPDPRRSQMLMRGRIYAQGFTLVAFLGYAALSSIEIKPKSKE